MKDEQMVCLKCGHIAEIGAEYIFYTGDDAEDFPECPKCGEYNIGGYPSFCEYGELSEENQRIIGDIETWWTTTQSCPRCD